MSLTSLVSSRFVNSHSRFHQTSFKFLGWTPLHEATNHGHYHLAQLLVKHGANVNATGLDDVTPLHDAASFGNQKLVKMLLDKGADPLFKNKKGKTAQDTAHPSLVNFFANLTSGEFNFKLLIMNSHCLLCKGLRTFEISIYFVMFHFS